MFRIKSAPLDHDDPESKHFYWWVCLACGDEAREEYPSRRACEEGLAEHVRMDWREHEHALVTGRTAWERLGEG
jgi:hypothetical protein